MYKIFSCCFDKPKTLEDVPSIKKPTVDTSLLDSVRTDITDVPNSRVTSHNEDLRAVLNSLGFKDKELAKPVSGLAHGPVIVTGVPINSKSETSMVIETKNAAGGTLNIYV